MSQLLNRKRVGCAHKFWTNNENKLYCSNALVAVRYVLTFLNEIEDLLKLDIVGDFTDNLCPQTQLPCTLLLKCPGNT
jgi:hypothetical protein